MANMLRGYFRLQEGEVIGALMLFRKAADAYSPEAAPQLANVYEMIARQETLLGHPVAARAALQRAVHFNSADTELRNQFESIFGDDARLPKAARKKYTFRATGKPLPPGADSGKLADAKKALDAIAKQYPSDPATLFNLGLIRAWLGENGPAIEALSQSLELENDDFRAEETGALLEVLKCAETAGGLSDFVDYRIVLPIRDGEAVMRLLQTMEAERRLLGSQIDEENGVFSSLVIEELPSLLDTGTVMGKVVSNLMVGGGAIRLWHTVKESVERIALEMRDRVTLAVGEPVASQGPVNFWDIGLEASLIPCAPPVPRRPRRRWPNTPSASCSTCCRTARSRLSAA